MCEQKASFPRVTGAERY